MQQYKLATNGEGLDPATAWRGVGQAYAGSSARAAKTEGRGRLDADVRTPAETENRTEQRAGACAQKLEQERRPSSRVHSRDFEKNVFFAGVWLRACRFPLSIHHRADPAPGIMTRRHFCPLRTYTPL
jgi:hypothetical protein